MLNKLATIADLADANGLPEVADDIDSFIKSASVWDGFAAMINPERYYLDRGVSLRNRFLTGLKRGRIDRTLGSLIALVAQRDDLDRQIAERAKPIADFRDKLSQFYDAIISKSIAREKLKDSLKDLQREIRQMSREVHAPKLKSLLEQRDKFNDNILKAIDKLRGINDQNKTKLKQLIMQPGGNVSTDLSNALMSATMELSENEADETAQPPPAVSPAPQAAPPATAAPNPVTPPISIRQEEDIENIKPLEVERVPPPAAATSPQTWTDIVPPDGPVAPAVSTVPSPKRRHRKQPLATEIAADAAMTAAETINTGTASTAPIEVAPADKPTSVKSKGDLSTPKGLTSASAYVPGIIMKNAIVELANRFDRSGNYEIATIIDSVLKEIE